MDGLWSAMLNAVADLVSGNEAEADSRRYTHGLAAAAADRHRARYFATSVLQHMPVKADLWSDAFACFLAPPAHKISMAILFWDHSSANM